MIQQECIGIPDTILLLKIKAEMIVCPGGAYFSNVVTNMNRARW